MNGVNMYWLIITFCWTIFIPAVATQIIEKEHQGPNTKNIQYKKSKYPSLPPSLAMYFLFCPSFRATNSGSINMPCWASQDNVLPGCVARTSRLGVRSQKETMFFCVSNHSTCNSETHLFQAIHRFLWLHRKREKGDPWPQLHQLAIYFRPPSCRKWVETSVLKLAHRITVSPLLTWHQLGRLFLGEGGMRVGPLKFPWWVEIPKLLPFSFIYFTYHLGYLGFPSAIASFNGRTWICVLNG